MFAPNLFVYFFFFFGGGSITYDKTNLLKTQM